MHMRRTAKILTALTFAALLTPLFAQPPRQPGGFTGRGGFGMDLSTLVVNKSVQEEVKMTPEQVEKFTKVSEEMKSKRGEGTKGKGGDKGKGGFDREAFQKAREERVAAYTKVMDETLKPEQIKRIKQIELQQGGLAVYTKENVQKELKLTDKQTTEIKEISEETQKDIGQLTRDLFGGQGNQEKAAEARKKIEGLRKEAEEKITGLLTEDQKKTWKTMVGEKFEIKVEAPMGRRPGGQGQGGNKNKQDF